MLGDDVRNLIGIKFRSFYLERVVCFRTRSTLELKVKTCEIKVSARDSAASVFLDLPRGAAEAVTGARQLCEGSHLTNLDLDLEFADGRREKSDCDENFGNAIINTGRQTERKQDGRRALVANVFLWFDLAFRDYAFKDSL